MAYSVIDIVNLGLGKIGVRKIASLTEQTDAAIQAALVWPYVLDELLEAHNWTFATTRVTLAQNTITPVQGFDFAYTLPPDFLKMCLQKENDPVVYPDETITPIFYQNQFLVRGLANKYSIELALDGNGRGTHCLFTSYDNSDTDLVIRYIRREANPALYSSKFIMTASAGVGRECAMPLREDLKVLNAMILLYDKLLIKAKAADMANDFLPDETGNGDWINAGRTGNWPSVGRNW